MARRLIKAKQKYQSDHTEDDDLKQNTSQDLIPIETEDSSTVHDPDIVFEEEFLEEVSPDLSEEEETSLVRISGLQLYLKELRKYPLLSKEQEREIAIKAYEEHDVEAKNKLVTSNLRLVVKISMDYRRAYTQLLDLIQEGNTGLVQAVNRFDPYKGVKLSTYSAWWIRAYILKFLMDNKSLVRIGTTDAQRKLFFRLRKEAEKLYALTQRFDANLLADRMGVEPQDVIEMQERLTKNDLSLNAPVGEDGDQAKIDFLQTGEESSLSRIEREELLTLLQQGLKVVTKELNERDQFILKERILADDPITLQEVGDHFKITRERARQLESKVIDKIRSQFKIMKISE